MKILTTTILFLAVLLSTAQDSGRDSIKNRIKTIYGFLEQKNSDSLVSCVSEDYIFYDPAARITLKGKEETIRYLESIFQIQKDIKFDIRDIFFLNDLTVQVKGMWSGEFNGKPSKAPFITIFIFNKNGLLVHQTDHFDLESLLN